MAGRFRFIFVGLLAVANAANAAPTVNINRIGDIRYTRQSVNFRLEIVQPAEVAVVYDDNLGSRTRLLTADGKLTNLQGGVNNALFDEFIWNEAEKSVYALSSQLSRLSLADRQFHPLDGQPRYLRDIEYVPRWGATLASGVNGLYIVKGGKIQPFPIRGPALNDVVRVKDLPRFKALFLETIDKRIFLLTNDRVLHSLGRLAGDHDTTHQIVELRGSAAFQVNSDESVAHVTMALGPDGIWRPSKFQWFLLGGISPATNGYVPQLDAMVVRDLSRWTLFDWLFDRSGLYRVTEEGLMPIGNWVEHVGKYPAIITLPSIGISLYAPNFYLNGPRPLFRMGKNNLIRENRLTPLGPYFSIREVGDSGIIVAKTPKGSWVWGGNTKPVLMANLPWGESAELPLSHEVLMRSHENNILVKRDGSAIRIPSYQSRGQIFQVDRNRWFEFGDSISEIRLIR